jgi:hypothetical protein
MAILHGSMASGMPRKKHRPDFPAPVSSKPSQGGRTAHRGTQKIKKRPHGLKRKAKNFCAKRQAEEKVNAKNKDLVGRRPKPTGVAFGRAASSACPAVARLRQKICTPP